MAGAGQAGGGASRILSFQALSTRKRKGVTTDNTAVAVELFLFDLLLWGDPPNDATGDEQPNDGPARPLEVEAR